MFGFLVYPLAITQIDLILTCAEKGTIIKNYPSESERTYFYLSNLFSYSLKIVFPEPAYY